MKKGTRATRLVSAAAFNAAAIQESEENWREAVNIYKRVIEATFRRGRRRSNEFKKFDLNPGCLF